MKELLFKLRVAALAAACAILFTGAIRQKTVQCEEAIAHLRSCCPTLAAENVCGDGCNPVTLEGEESQCILDRDCEELEEGEVCQRVIELSAAAADLSDDSDRVRVCP